mgnify:CR=1 FL=1
MRRGNVDKTKITRPPKKLEVEEESGYGGGAPRGQSAASKAGGFG